MNIRIIIGCFLSAIAFNATGSNTDSLKIELKIEENDSSKLDILFELFKEYYYKHSDTALTYGMRGIELAEKTNNESQKALFYNACGQFFLQKSEYDKALNYHFKSLKLREKLELDYEVATSLNNIGLVYQRIGRYEQSSDYFSKALKINNEINNEKGMAVNTGNLSIIYAEQDKYEDAIGYANKALGIYEKLKDSIAIAATLNNLGNYNTSLGNFNLGIDFYRKALQVSQNIGDENGIAIRLANIGELFIKQNQIDSAYFYFKESLEISHKTRNLELISSNYLSVSDVLYNKGEYKKAFEYRTKSYELQDSLLNEKVSEQISEMSAKYEVEKKELQIKSLEDEKKLQQSEIRNQQIILWSAAGGGVLLIVFTTLLYNRFKTTRKQKDIIEIQKHTVEEKQKEITDSITYAKRIQEAILPPESFIKDVLPNSFFLYKPKDIVSGDFYWVEQNNNKVLFAAVDCTGHGVPGAFVSIVGHNGLTRTVNEFGLTQPAQILNKLNELVEETLRQKNNEVRDGMDISLCSIDFSANRLEYAGANNPLYLIRNGEIQITKADKQAIGGADENKTFTNHTFGLQKGDSIYVFSDGFADQFGGPKDKKYGYAKFRRFLLSIQDQSMNKQLNALNIEFNNWKGKSEQLDDVCIIGIKI